jgi:hypothetical protein
VSSSAKETREEVSLPAQSGVFFLVICTEVDEDNSDRRSQCCSVWWCFAPSSGASAEQQVCASENASARIPVPQPILKGSEKVEILIATLLGVRWAKSRSRRGSGTSRAERKNRFPVSQNSFSAP